MKQYRQQQLQHRQNDVKAFTFKKILKKEKNRQKQYQKGKNKNKDIHSDIKKFNKQKNYTDIKKVQNKKLKAKKKKKNNNFKTCCCLN